MGALQGEPGGRAPLLESLKGYVKEGPGNRHLSPHGNLEAYVKDGSGNGHLTPLRSPVGNLEAGFI
jgi:hypothetical protein